MHSSRVGAGMQPPMPATLGIVLAGGGSSRLGSVAEAAGGKASLTVRGRSFLEHVVAAVAAEVDRTIVVAAPGQMLPTLAGVSIVHDATPGAGPLAGLRDGLRAAQAVEHGAPTQSTLAFVASCDVPLLRREVVHLLIDVARRSAARWTVPSVHGHRQVLVSVLHVDLLPRIEAWLAAGRRDLRGLFAEIARVDPRTVCEVTEAALTAVDPHLESFLDIDTPDDLERLQSR